MFRIACDPSSGSTELNLTEITRDVSKIFFVCLVGVWQRNFEPAVCVHGTTSWACLTVHTYRKVYQFAIKDIFSSLNTVKLRVFVKETGQIF